jgi:hypothetical protein
MPEPTKKLEEAIKRLKKMQEAARLAAEEAKKKKGTGET